MVAAMHLKNKGRIKKRMFWAQCDKGKCNYFAKKFAQKRLNFDKKKKREKVSVIKTFTNLSILQKMIG